MGRWGREFWDAGTRHQGCKKKCDAVENEIELKILSLYALSRPAASQDFQNTKSDDCMTGSQIFFFFDKFRKIKEFIQSKLLDSHYDELRL